jgi:murein DD-endopeptidase MepM/ murein hydrolase activator NlpD
MEWRVNYRRRRRFGVAPKGRIADSASAARAIPAGKGGATMTAFWVRTALLGASAMALQACDLPHSQYAPYEGYQTPTARPMAQPQYPATADQPMHSADPHDPVAKPSGDVTSQPLPPPGPSSANRSMFIDAVYDGAEPAVLTDVAYHHRHSHAVHVSARGRLEQTEAPHSVKIKKGDTVEALAEKYGTTKEAILRANHIRHPHDLAVGMTLKIPSDASESAEAPAEPESRSGREGGSRAETREARATSKPYVTHNGDTLYSLGRRYHVSPRLLADLNGLPPDFHLHIGQHIRLPGEETAAEAEAEAPPARRVATVRGHDRVHGTFAPPLAPNDTAIAGVPTPPVAESAPPVRPTRLARNDIGPAEPVPYTSLPGHLTGPAYVPPQRPTGPAFVPPQRPTGPAYIPPVNLPQAAPTPPDAQVVLAGRGRFVWPVHGPVLSNFGPKAGGQRSDGLDISAPTGAAVHAAATGDVVYAGDLVPGLGNLVLIKHDDGWITAYAHLSRTEVKIKDHVMQGAEIGLAGQTGGAAQSEVYFEIRYAPTPRDKAKPVDPSLLLSSQ